MSIATSAEGFTRELESFSFFVFVLSSDSQDEAGRETSWIRSFQAQEQPDAVFGLFIVSTGKDSQEPEMNWNVVILKWSCNEDSELDYAYHSVMLSPIAILADGESIFLPTLKVSIFACVIPVNLQTILL